MTSFVLRFNPLVPLLAGISALAGSLALRTLATAVIAVALWAIIAVVTVPSWRYVLVCLGFASLAAGSIVYSTWRMGGHDIQVALTAGLRILVLAWPGTVAVGFIDTARLGDYLGQSLRLPARFVVAFTAALQRFTSMHHTWAQLAVARKTRGVGPDRRPLATVKYASSMAFGLLASTIRQTTQSAMAMDARGFTHADRRTWLEPAVWSRLDIAGVCAVLALGLWPVAYQLMLIAV